MSLKKISLQHNVDLRANTTIKIGGIARYFLEASSPDDLQQIIADYGQSLYILGKGSNLLVHDEAVNIPVVKLAGSLRGVEKKDNLLEVGAATPFSSLLNYCLKNNFLGFEHLAGIPASLGGMLVMNASSFDGQICEHLVSVEVMDNSGGVKILPKDQIRFGYRSSSLEDYIVLRARFKLPAQSSGLGKRLQYFLKKRLTIQDFHFPSCGCIFKNTDMTSAGFLIDSCGLKGFSRGQAQVSPRHANFIINRGRAKYTQVDYLIQLIKDKVYKKYGIILQEEIKRWT